MRTKSYLGYVWLQRMQGNGKSKVHGVVYYTNKVRVAMICFSVFLIAV